MAPSTTASDAILDQRLRIVTIDLVLCRTGERDSHRHRPRALAGVEARRREFLGILFDAPAADFFQFLEEGELFRVDAIRVVDEA